MMESLGITQFFAGKYLAALTTFEEALQIAYVTTVTLVPITSKKGKEKGHKEKIEKKDTFTERSHARISTLVSYCTSTL